MSLKLFNAASLSGILSGRTSLNGATGLNGLKAGTGSSGRTDLKASSLSLALNDLSVPLVGLLLLLNDGRGTGSEGDPQSGVAAENKAEELEAGV